MVDEVDQQNTVFRRQAHQHHDADDGEHIQRVAREPQRHKHADENQGQRHHDGDGQGEAAELRHQNQVNEDDAQGQGLQGVQAGFLHVFARALLHQSHAAGQV